MNCGVTSGAITALSSSGYAGASGICHNNEGTVSGCFNKAQITLNGSSRESYVGGIAGGNYSLITNCYNKGNVINTCASWTYTGGIVGVISWGNYYDSIMNCYNTGTVSVPSSSNRFIGSIRGNATSGATISNSYYTEDNVPYTTRSGYGSPKVSNVQQVSEEELKTYASTLGVEFIEDKWEINDGYPILWWEGPRLELNKNQAYIKENGELQLSVMAAQSACPKEILDEILKGEFEWTSSNEDVATVDQNGKVTGKKDGYTTIYARHRTDGLYAMCVVNVAKDTATPQIATGNGFTAFLKSDGKVYTIGNNEKGQLGYEVGARERVGSGIAFGSTLSRAALGNSAEQNLLGIPCPVHTDIDTELTNVIKIAVGSNHVLALTNDGKVYSWGDNEDSKYATPVLGTDGASYLTNIVDIDAGGYGSVALDEDGNVYVWGKGENGELGNNRTEDSNIPTKVTGVKDAIQVSMGNGHVGALTSDGVVFTWGLNTNGQLGIGSTTNALYPTRTALDVTEISLGGYHTAIKKIDGKLYVAGASINGRLGLGTEVTGNQTTFTEVNLEEILTDGSKIKYVKSGIANTTILLSNGTVWETGFNLHGELGNGTNITSTTFVQGLTGENTPIQNVLTIGKNMGNVEGSETLGYGLDTALILENGDIYTTGNNEYRQIGNNDTKDTTYYTKMWYAYLDYEEKSVEIEGTQGYPIDREKIRYIQSVVNAYNNEPLLEVGEVKYKIQDTTLATVSNDGYITANDGVTGATKVEIEDTTNGYKAYFTLIVNKLENTDTVTYIYDSQDMCEFRDSVNAGNDYAGKTVYVMADIDLSDVCSASIGSFEPIGTGKNEEGKTVYFSGTFDGNYHTIDKLYMNSDKYMYLGLFTAINSSAIIKNLILDNINICNYNYTKGNVFISAAGITTNNARKNNKLWYRKRNYNCKKYS